MNADVKLQQSLSSTDVQGRIDDERRRLLIEQNLEHDLTGQRIAPLEAGDDVALDRIESQLNQCRERQFRIQERIELLEARHAAAIDAEANAELDALAARGDRAREYGERLIAQYGQHATALAAMLGKLAAVEEIIVRSNYVLMAAGRAGIHSPNKVRCRFRGEGRTEKVVKRVGIHDPAHPYYGRATPIGGISHPGNTIVRTANIDDEPGKTCPVFMDVEVEVHHQDSGDFPEALQNTVRLPGIGPAPANQGLVPLWDGDYPVIGQDLIEVVTAEIDGKPEAEPAKRAARGSRA